MSDELDDEVHDRIQNLCDEGDAFAKNSDFLAALAKYWSAWDQLPESQTEWGLPPGF